MCTHHLAGWQCTLLASVLGVVIHVAGGMKLFRFGISAHPLLFILDRTLRFLCGKRQQEYGVASPGRRRLNILFGPCRWTSDYSRTFFKHNQLIDIEFDNCFNDLNLVFHCSHYLSIGSSHSCICCATLCGSRKPIDSTFERFDADSCARDYLCSFAETHVASNRDCEEPDGNLCCGFGRFNNDE